MASLLDEIVAHKREEVAQRKLNHPLTLDVPTPMVSEKLTFQEALLPTTPMGPTKLILEVKPASPSAGVLVETLDLEGLLSDYNPYAAGISVLTDQRYFHGSLALLKDVNQKSPHPILCKDFILEPYQILEAYQHGAQAVLLIVKILTDTTLAELMAIAEGLKMDAIVEVQSETELYRALAFDPSILLINNRNLETFDIDLKTTERLSALIPPDILRISASGIKTVQDIQHLKPFCNAFLVGSALMKASSETRQQLLKAMVSQ